MGGLSVGGIYHVDITALEQDTYVRFEMRMELKPNNRFLHVIESLSLLLFGNTLRIITVIVFRAGHFFKIAVFIRRHTNCCLRDLYCILELP